MRRISGLAALFVALWCSTSLAGKSAGLPPLPALNTPATTEHLPGKFIFADFFTSDIEAARRFYGGLFGWEWRWINPDHSYGMFYQDDIAVAGIALHEAGDANQSYGRWIYYLSSGDVEKQVADISAHGGRVLLEPIKLAARGTLSVVVDGEGAPFGLLNSSSGDPADYRAEPGEWLWVSLYSRDTQKALDFYRMLFGYDISDAEDTGDGLGFILSKGGIARAGVGRLPMGYDSYPTWLGYIRVEDVAASVAEAVALGGEVLLGPDPAMADGNLAVISDPMGAPIALIHWTFYDGEAGR